MAKVVAKHFMMAPSISSNSILLGSCLLTASTPEKG
jgi:hypothetical protein